MATTQSYVDIGACQRKEDGTTPTPNRSYVDIGAAQRQETAAAAGRIFKLAGEGGGLAGWGGGLAG